MVQVAHQLLLDGISYLVKAYRLLPGGINVRNLLAHSSWLLRLFVVACALLISGCKDDSKTGSESIGLQTSDNNVATVLLSQILIDDYVLISSRRVGRTVNEYTLKAIAINNSSTRYTNVTATLVSAPPNITIVDNTAVLGTVPGGASITSADEFVIRVDLLVKTSLNDLVWQVNGSLPSTGGGGGGSPEKAGIFMSIDENSEIKGDSTSKSHQDWIILESFGEGSNVIFDDRTGGGSATGKVDFDGVTVRKGVDSSSPLLRRALTEGDYFTEVKIDIVKVCDANLYTAYAITLTVSALSSLGMSSSDFGVPLESLVFDYSRIETMYTPVDQDCKLGIPVYSFQDAAGGKV